ncbi:hypothetical protein, partial [Sinorhizobium medicae]|uniref:hypothetical protein n=1 Tax=Sinorhizobium medicae TaxID=110321 RepID=UPI0027DC59F8
MISSPNEPTVANSGGAVETWKRGAAGGLHAADGPELDLSPTQKFCQTAFSQWIQITRRQIGLDTGHRARVPLDTLCDHRRTNGTFYFQVRHANDFNGFPLEILE